MKSYIKIDMEKGGEILEWTYIPTSRHDALPNRHQARTDGGQLGNASLYLWD